MSKRNRYDREFKVQAVKLALEIGQTKACNELQASGKHNLWLDARISPRTT